MNDKTSSAQSDGIAQGDNAQGNTNVTGGVGGDVVRGSKTVINNYEAQAAAITSLHQIQPPPRDFTGREAEINELMEMLEHGGVTISGLQGLGGVGKTTLALKLAEELKDKYPDAQFYLDLKGADAKPLPIADVLAHVIRAYHPTAKLPESVDELRGLYLSVLHNQKALLLMDNARDEQQVEPLIPPPGCLLMVTSRFHFTVPGLKVKNLDALLPEDAVKLLLEIAPRISDQAAEIARLCGNLPLGLRLAASFLSTRANFKVADYVRKLSTASERLKLIDASLSLSYELLSDTLKTNWIALSVFPDSFDQHAAAAIWRLDEAKSLERLSKLLTFSLVEWSEETDRYRLHDLARVFADSKVTDSERITYYNRQAIRCLQLTQEELRLSQQLMDDLKNNPPLSNGDWGRTQAHLEILRRLNETTRRIIELSQQIIPIMRMRGNHKVEFQSFFVLGSCYKWLGEFQRAVGSYKQSLAIAREFGDHIDEASALWNTALVMDILGDRAQAIALAEAALVIKEQIEAPNTAEVREQLEAWRSE